MRRLHLEYYVSKRLPTLGLSLHENLWQYGESETGCGENHDPIV